MKNIEIVSKVVARKGEALASPSKDASTVNLSDYLLKSIWDKVFELRTDSQGTEYIFGKFPMVTQYGITVYSGDGVDVPSLASGLPFDGRTIWYNPETQQIEVIGGTGGGSGEGVSNFWDLSGIPSWITNSKPKYSYSEIEGTPDLSGYATQSWVENKKYLTAITSAMVTSALGFTPYNSANFTKANIKSTLGISDWALASSKPSYTTSDVTEGSNLYFTNTRAINALAETLKAYVTLPGSQTITGEKNFVGGLKVNGSPIYYDTEKKYWKLEGDLLVTGGVTMYGSDSSFTPSTIMDAIAVDGTTISKSGGVLKVIGGTGGGVADSVAWANITGKPTWIGSSKPTYSYSEITGAISTTELQNYLTSNSYLNVAGGDNRYLQLSGGTLASSGNPLSIKRTDGNGPGLVFYSENAQLGSIGISTDYVPKFYNANVGLLYTIWHSGNFNPSNYLPLSGGTLSDTLFINRDASFGLYLNNTKITNSTGYSGIMFQYGGNNSVGLIGNSNGSLQRITSDYSAKYTIWDSGNDGADSGLDADMLDGKHADSFMNFAATKTYVGASMGNENLSKLASGDGYIEFWDGAVGWFNGKWGKLIAVSGFEGSLSGNASSATKFQTARTIWGQPFDGTGNVFGQLSMVASKIFWHDDNKNYYIGCPTISGGAYLEYKAYSGHAFLGGNVGIGTTSPSAKLHVSGDILATERVYARYVFMSKDNEGIYFSGGGIAWHNTSNSYYSDLISFTKDSINLKQSTTVQGNILATGAMTFYSMRKLKNIVDERGLSLSELSKIKPTRYTWKDGRDNRLHFGGIADDIQQVLPEVVYTTSDGILTMDYGNAAFAVASSLIKPVVDHEKRIEMLEAENKQLRQEVERLKSA